MRPQERRKGGWWRAEKGGGNLEWGNWVGGKRVGRGGGGLLPDVYFKGMEFLGGGFWVCKWGPNEAVN